MAKGSQDGFWRSADQICKHGNISLGHFRLDFAIQYGQDPTGLDLSSVPGYDPKTSLGIPLGKVLEIFGEEGGGKSSLALRVCGVAQKKGYEVAWIDGEHSFSDSLAEINGLDIHSPSFKYSNLIDAADEKRMYFAEDILQKIEDAVEAGIKVVVLDSIASLVPREEYEKGMDSLQVSLLARVLGKGIKKMLGTVEKKGALVILINQIRDNPSIKFGSTKTTPGGHAAGFYSSLRLEIAKKRTKDAEIKTVDEDTGEEILIGRYAYAYLRKNRFGKPISGGKGVEIPIYYEKYFPDIEEIVFDAARQVRVISVRKGVFSWGDIKIEGKNEFISYLKENNLILSLISDLKDKAEGVILPPEIDNYLTSVDRRENDYGVSGNVQGRGQEEDSGTGEEKPKKRGRKSSSQLSDE